MDWREWFIRWSILCQQEYVRFKTPKLRSDLCDYSDAYIVVKVAITAEGTNLVKWRNKKLTFKNIASFCISVINNILIDNAKDLDTLMLMHNLLEYSENNSMTWGSLLNCYRDEENDHANAIFSNRKLNNNK